MQFSYNMNNRIYSFCVIEVDRRRVLLFDLSCYVKFNYEFLRLMEVSSFKKDKHRKQILLKGFYQYVVVMCCINCGKIYRLLRMKIFWVQLQGALLQGNIQCIWRSCKSILINSLQYAQIKFHKTYIIQKLFSHS
jgi:hypothetical protein